jgi:hypothetical protein
MGKLKEAMLEEHYELWAQHEEAQRNELRAEGAKEVCLMIKYDLESKLKAATVLNKPTDPRPTALREAIKLVEQYL